MPTKDVTLDGKLLGEFLKMTLRSDGSGWLIPFAPVGNGGFQYSPVGSNSFSTALSQNGTLTGAKEEIVQASGLVVTVNAVYAGTITINWFQDPGGAVRDAPAQVFDVSAGAPLALSLPAQGNYFQITYLQTGAGTGNVFIDTYQGQLPQDIQGGGILETISTVAVNTALQLPAKTSLKGVTVKAAATNDASGVWIGKANVAPGANGFPLFAGQSVTFPAGNLNVWYMCSASSIQQTIYIIGA